MQNLTSASRELFRRSPDERFESLATLAAHCSTRKSQSSDRWHPPTELGTRPTSDRLAFTVGNDGAYQMNDWSFSQLCKLAGISKDTVNRLSPETASRAFGETLPRTNKPLQLFTEGDLLRSLHGTSYTRVHDADLVEILQEFSGDFQPPQKGFNGATGLYCGEQDMFCFLIDPAGWVDIDGESFAPGFFLWNSEVGRRSLGIQTFWFQQICANHIVWDATEVMEFTRKHTASVHESVGEIRRIIEALAAKRDARKDSFSKVVAKAMREKLGEDAEETLTALTKGGVSRSIAKQAIESVKDRGRFTIFALVDALTRISGDLVYAGDRIELDQKAGALLALAA